MDFFSCPVDLFLFFLLIMMGDALVLIAFSFTDRYTDVLSCMYGFAFHSLYNQ